MPVPVFVREQGVVVPTASAEPLGGMIVDVIVSLVSIAVLTAFLSRYPFFLQFLSITNTPLSSESLSHQRMEQATSRSVACVCHLSRFVALRFRHSHPQARCRHQFELQHVLLSHNIVLNLLFKFQNCVYIVCCGQVAIWEQN